MFAYSFSKKKDVVKKEVKAKDEEPVVNEHQNYEYRGKHE